MFSLNRIVSEAMRNFRLNSFFSKARTRSICKMRFSFSRIWNFSHLGSVGLGWGALTRRGWLCVKACLLRQTLSLSSPTVTAGTRGLSTFWGWVWVGGRPYAGCFLTHRGQRPVRTARTATATAPSPSLRGRQIDVEVRDLADLCSFARAPQLERVPGSKQRPHPWLRACPSRLPRPTLFEGRPTLR